MLGGKARGVLVLDGMLVDTVAVADGVVCVGSICPADFDDARSFERGLHMSRGTKGMEDKYISRV